MSDWKSLNIGGYYEDLYDYEQIKNMAWWFTTGKMDYSPKYTSRAIYYALSNGYSFAMGNSAHAFTVYGATFDTETQLVTSLYVCDSAGAYFNKSKISRARVNLNTADNTLYIPGYYHENNTYEGINTDRIINNIYFLGNTEKDTWAFITSGAPIPEPSAFGLLAGLGALALAGTRRKRR